MTPRDSIADMILSVLRSLQEASGIGPESVKKAARGAQDLTISAVQNLPEPFKKPVRQAVGRVATNVIYPVGYDEGTGAGNKVEQTMKAFSPSELSHTIRSIVKDQPNYTPDYYAVSQIAARRPLFREYFDLPPQDTEDVFLKKGKSYRINPDSKNEVAKETMEGFAADQNALAGGVSYPYNKPTPEQRASFLSRPRNNFISGNYFIGKPDPWNFDLSPKEIEAARGRPLKVGEFVRSMFEALGKPAVLETGGYNNPEPDEEMTAKPIADDGPPLASNSLTSRDLRQFPPWMRDILRTTPDYPKAERPGTHQADPRMVPIIPIDPAGNRAFDPTLGRSDAMMLAYLNKMMGMPKDGQDDQTTAFQPIAMLIRALAGGGQT